MGNIFRINCYKLYETGMHLDSYGSELKDVIDDMKKVNNEISDTWNGTDYDSFCKNFDEYLSSIENLQKSILEKAALFKSIATKHGKVDKNMSYNFYRSMRDE